MSSTEETVEGSDVVVCNNCGVAEVDEIKLLEDCDGCKSVRCCGDKCKDEHRQRHEEEFKKTEAELHDKKIFTQPDGSHEGECPICFLPMPLHKKLLSKHAVAKQFAMVVNILIT